MRRLADTARSRRSGDDSVLPLINVVFLLLIFFMLAGQLAITDPFEVAPPRSETESDPQAQDVMILLSRDGRIAIDGRPVERSALPDALKEIAAGQVRLKADGDANAVEVVELMELLRDSGVRRLNLLTLPASE
ncbi:MAG: ExbD/TolR family protein [Minwuia sp.]|uniref:ExbD/TolR family protein n=1 Tax=Minwuia sp. TaxID=2493630 RepID=UPI003A8AB158